ncbi:MAG: adenosine deaminase [Planctomycetota bacterium]|jgi:adenosine deaminase
MSAGGEKGAGTATFDREAVRSMPKVELHRHLEGSLPPEFFLEMAKEFSIELPAGDAEGLAGAITMVGQEPGFLPFLQKFETLRTFYVDPEVIKRAAREAIRLASEDNVRYLELRYNPLHFATQMAFRIEDVIEWVTEARDEAAAEFTLQVELIATVNRNDPVQESLPTIEAAIAGAGQHFAGIDIAGDENQGNLVRFAGVFRKARKAGLGITIHAGEVGPATNVRDAIRLLGADRIGHGIRVLEDPEVVKMAKEAGVVFEVCPTSNFRTGAAQSIEAHPIADMARAELAVTLSTDDPVTCGTTLTDEYVLVGNALGLEKSDFLELNLTALQGAFRPKDERAELASMFEDEFSSAGG